MSIGGGELPVKYFFRGIPQARLCSSATCSFRSACVLVKLVYTAGQMRRLVFLLGTVCLASSLGWANPAERGKVVAVRIVEQNRFIPGYDDGRGARSSGVTVRDRTHIYRIETSTRFYEFEGGRKQVFAVGTTIEFRIEKRMAYIEVEGKERKFRIIGEETK